MAVMVMGPLMAMLGASRVAPLGTFHRPVPLVQLKPDAKDTSVPVVTSTACSVCRQQQQWSAQH